MAPAPPSAPSSRSRKRSTFSRLVRAMPMRRRGLRSCPDRLRSGGLDVVAQRFLLGLVFPNPPLDDIADGNQADHPLALDHRQMPEFSQRHHFHDRADGVGLPA